MKLLDRLLDYVLELLTREPCSVRGCKRETVRACSTNQDDSDTHCFEHVHLDPDPQRDPFRRGP